MQNFHGMMLIIWTEIKHLFAKKKDPYTGGPKTGKTINKQVQKGKGGITPTV